MKQKLLTILISGLILSILIISPVLAAVDDSYTQSLLHLNGTDNSTTITDEQGRTWTAHGNAVLKTGTKKFGNASVYSPGGSGDYIDTASSGNMEFGSGDFTVDFWFNPADTPTGTNCPVIYNKAMNSQDLQWCGGSGTPFLRFEENGLGYLHGNVTMSIGTWYHIAVVRNGSDWQIYVNGNSIGSDTRSVTLNSNSNNFKIFSGAYSGSQYINGYIDEFRLSKGIARWTSNFTPPTGEYEGPTPTPTNTATNTNTPTATDTPTNTPTPSYTPTASNTHTPSYTPTASNTPTITNTVLPSNTPTPTLTATPGNGIVWAPGTVTLSDALRDEIGDLLTTNPPAEASGNVYAITNISGNDAAWNVSIANIIGLSAPYDTWNIEDNVNWSWFVECTGTEPNWSCHYYTLPSMGGGNTLRLPWKSGYYAIYGVAGVHSGAIMIPDSMGIDLFGSDSDNGSMPPLVVAAGDGTITSVCSDSQTMAIRVDGGPVPLGYFHFDIGQDFQEGQRISQGDILGSLKHGTFSGTRCGWANQRSDQYHIHFVFKETSSGYFSIGGCVLDINTQNFVCNGSTYGTLSKIPNGGEPSPPGGTPDPDAPPGYKTSEGGPHIWDGIVDAIIKLNSNTLSKYLPNQNPTIKYAIEKVNLLLQSVIGIFLLFMTFGISASVILIIIIAVISQELTYRGLVLLFGAGKTILPFLKYI